MAFVGILSQIKLLSGPLVIQLVGYILKQLFTSVSVKEVDIYLAVKAFSDRTPCSSSPRKKIIPLNHSPLSTTQDTAEGGLVLESSGSKWRTSAGDGNIHTGRVQLKKVLN